MYGHFVCHDNPIPVALRLIFCDLNYDFYLFSFVEK